MKNNSKGIVRALSAGDKIKLTMWLIERKEDVQRATYDDIAKQASLHIGREVSPSSIATYVLAMWPEMKRKPAGPHGRTATDIVLLKSELAMMKDAAVKDFTYARIGRERIERRVLRIEETLIRIGAELGMAIDFQERLTGDAKE